MEAHRDLMTRAVDEARRRSDGHCGPEHALLALARPPAPTAASRTLAQLDLEPPTGAPEPDRGGFIEITRQFQQVLAFAAGMALASGTRVATDELALLAVCFHAPEALAPSGATPREVVAALAAHGVDVPDVDPPNPEPPIDWGPAVYVSEADFEAVTRMIADELAPDRVQVSFNVSTWQPGRLYFLAPDDIALANLVRGVVSDPDGVAVVPLADAMEREQPDRPGG